MATPLINFKISLEVCPQCLYEAKVYARLDGLDKWELKKECFCRYIQSDFPWIFEEEPTLAAVKPEEFGEWNIQLHG